MNREDIIRMAREAGFGGGGFVMPTHAGHITHELERFAALVASAEREACVGLRKEVVLQGKHSTEYEDGFWDALQKYEDLIRARGQA